MGIYTEEIKKFAVKVTYDSDDSCGDGSGVLVKINDNTCYVVTAKHNFKVGANKIYKDVDVKNLKLNLDKIKINKDVEKNICTIDKIIYEDNKYDILIFTTSNWTNYIKNLDKVNIDLTQSRTYEYYYFYGYPIDKEGTPSKRMEHHGYREMERHILRLDRVQSSKDDAVTGFSGSGIFGKNKNDNKFYLMGIFTEFEDDHEFYYGIDFNRIFDEVDKKLIIPIDDNANVKQLHVMHNKNGYIEPITVEINELGLHVAVCPVTFEEYDLFCEDDNRDKIEDYGYKTKRETFPIVNIKLQDAKEYCDWLYTKTDKKYRLLTSVEWDFLAERSLIPKDSFTEYVWYSLNSGKKIQRVGTTLKVGELGIYDLYGNVHEWCSDKVIRGGSSIYSSFESMLRKDNDICKDNYTGNKLGFRIVVKNNKN